MASEVRVNTITNRSGLSTVTFGAYGIEFVGITTVEQLNVSSGVSNINATGVSTFAGNIDANGDLDVEGHTELDNVNIAGVLTATSAEFSGNVTVLGDLTYENITNLDSVGIATARAGLRITGGGLDVVGVTTFNDNINLGDNDVLNFGASQDLKIYHSGSNSFIRDGGAGSLYVEGTDLTLRAGDSTTRYLVGNQSPGDVSLYYGNAKKFETASSGINVVGTTTTGQLSVTGVSTFAGGGNVSAGDWTFTGANYNVFWDNSADALKFNDGAKAVFGTDDDFTIVHTNADTILTDSGTGDVYLRNDNTVFIQNAAGTETKAEFISNGAVNLYHDNTNRLQTTSSGINVTGSVECDGLSVIGGDSVLEDSTLYVRKTSGYANIEVGGPTGAYIDLKSPNSDDFDFRFITTGTGGQIHVNGNNLSLVGHFIPETNNTYDLGTSGNKWRNGYFDTALYVDGPSYFSGTSEYQVVLKDNNNTGTAAETGIAFRDSADTTQGYIGYVESTSETLWVFNTRNSNVVFGTNNTPRCQVNSSGHFIPNADNTYNLGGASNRWANIYSADLQLSNEGSANDVDGTWGKYTIQEGENDLFLINRRSGKKYAFVLREVD